MAMCEVTKAATVLLFACGLFHLMHKNLDDVAERVVQVLHVNPEGKLSNLFFDLASHSSDRNLWVLALGTLAYASVRLTEAYGLWREREWAQWFSLLSTALYLPPELYWMLGHPSWLKCAVLVINIVIFLLMVSLASTSVRQLSAAASCNPPCAPAISLPRAAVQACAPNPVSPLALALADLRKHEVHESQSNWCAVRPYARMSPTGIPGSSERRGGTQPDRRCFGPGCAFLVSPPQP